MTLTPILEGADVDARLRSRRFSFPFILEIFATLLIVASMLFTSGCVGVAGKPGSSGGSTQSIEVSPSTINFGSLTVGQSASKTLQIINSGTKSLSISGISVAGTGFAVKAPALPLVLAAGQAGNVAATFTATATGSASGKIMISSSAPDSPMLVALSATTVAKASNLVVAPSSLSFGDVKVGSASTQTVQLKNSSSSAITVSALSITGSGLSLSAVSLPLTLSAGSSANLSAIFKPATAGNASGALTIKSNASDASEAIGWSGTGTTQTSTGSTLTATPPSIAFGNVPTGTATTQTIKIANSGNSPVTVSSVTASGAGLTVSGISTPLTLAVGSSANLTASLKPTASGAASGAIKLISNATADSSLQISWSASAESASVTLIPNPTALNFGNLTVGTPDTLQATLHNTGNVDADISSISVSGKNFGLVGSGSSATLAPGQTLTLNVSYSPASSGNGSGTLTVVSNAANKQISIPLSGKGLNGSQTSKHSVTLAWDASSGSIIGYYVYPSSKPSGPYARLNSASTPGTSYSDTTISNGQTYYYVVTAVNSSNIESTDSNTASASIPAD